MRIIGGGRPVQPPAGGTWWAQSKCDRKPSGHLILVSVLGQSARSRGGEGEVRSSPAGLRV